MKDWEKSSVYPDTSIEQAIMQMDKAAFRFLTVVNKEKKLLGVITDGDIRRSILNQVKLSNPVKEIMCHSPVTAHYKTSRADLLTTMRKHCLHHIPLVNQNKEVVDVVTIDQMLGLEEKPNLIVLMVGGLGTRLRPFTKTCPKPMLEIGQKPILEIILESFIAQGFRKFCFSVNYLSDVIKRYFKDGSQFGVEISYIEEEKKLGTAGSLSMMNQLPEQEFVVMNGDILTSINFEDMIKFHKDHQASATMAVRQYEFQVPYGVVSVHGAKIVNFDEKPRQKFFVNAGIYVLSPECLQFIPQNNEYDMPTLFSKLSGCKKQVVPYPLHEKWIDIGEVETFEHAKSEWKTAEEILD